MNGLSVLSILAAVAVTVAGVTISLLAAVLFLKRRDGRLERLADPRPTAAEIIREREDRTE